MASIRRTLSPYPNGLAANANVNALSPPKFPSNTNFSSSPPSRCFLALARFLDGDFLRRNSRKAHQKWKRSFYASCFLFFFLGFLFGVMPFGQVYDDDDDVVQNHDFSFANIRPPPPPPVVDITSIKDSNSIVGRVTVSQPENFVVDKVELAVDRRHRYDFIPRKQLIVITPTYNRAMQAYLLNRMIQVLRLVPPPLVWIVVEMNSESMETAEILRHGGVMYRHLVSMQNTTTNMKDRGVHQRNRALEHIQLHKLDGIVYFADDDNIYSLELFQRLRGIRRFGTWPVAMVEQGKNKAIVEGPVCNESKVIGWHTNEKSRRVRRFHVDMSGFAFNSTILWDHPKRWKRPNSKPIRQLDTVKEGFQETTFIEQLVEDERQMEGLGGCWRILNWHLHLLDNTGGRRGLGYPKGGWQLWKNLDAIIPIPVSKN